MVWWRWRREGRSRQPAVAGGVEGMAPASGAERAAEAGWSEAAGWRVALAGQAGGGRFGMGAGAYDALDWREQMRAAYEMYCHHPLAYAVVEQQTNFVLGGGARVVAADARVQRVVDGFWHDPENAMDQRIYALQTELSLFGEQFIRYFVDEVTGRVVVRQLDPMDVVEIETDPDDMERRIAYVYQAGSLGGLDGPVARFGDGVRRAGGASVAPDGGTAMVGAERIPAADVSHFAINRVSNALRGRSDLAPVMRWLASYAEWLSDRMRQNRLKTAFIYDVTVSGAGREELERIRAQHAEAPAPGTVLFHNEKETWQAVQPHIRAAEVRDDGRALRLMIAAGVGVPEHYLGEGGNVNRATAAEMGLPAIKRMQRRQEVLRHLLKTVCGRVVEEAARAGKVGPRVRRDLSVHFEELSPAAIDQEATAARALAEALALAEDRGWAEKAQARRLWWRFAGDPEEGMGRATSAE